MVQMKARTAISGLKAEKEEEIMGWQIGEQKQQPPQSHFSQETLVIILQFLPAFMGSSRPHVSLFSRALFSEMSLMAL